MNYEIDQIPYAILDVLKDKKDIPIHISDVYNSVCKCCPTLTLLANSDAANTFFNNVKNINNEYSFIKPLIRNGKLYLIYSYKSTVELEADLYTFIPTDSEIEFFRHNFNLIGVHWYNNNVLDSQIYNYEEKIKNLESQLALLKQGKNELTLQKQQILSQPHPVIPYPQNQWTCDNITNMFYIGVFIFATGFLTAFRIL